MRYLFFDFDGTIADTQEGIINALEYMVEKLDMENLGKDVYRQFIGPSLTYSLKKFYPDFPKERYPEAIKAYQAFYNTKGVYQLKIYPHMKDTLEKLDAAGYKLYVSSVKPESLIKKLIPHLGLENYFSGLYGASDDEMTRTAKTEILKYGMQSAGVDSKQTVMIGDRLTDMKGGIDNGVHTLGVLYGFGDRQELEESGAQEIAKEVVDIPETIKKF
ncbi:HAD hydrolase-like protein [Companilactobacillus halodurans]|uniref:HAD family hydrolase n=1 Tax=Companilactobacillus halodurans TaxID=2584183 RepID=A0A5P1A0W0_9LACO|nr:HAD hydrolase-like protein [Companilactobacillus halodurans]MQS76187.1 HAD family hydrolase [Companilactobacillus halodurans]MQS98488.1 HAD family hydrolase [Companilactobacillus halodurans]